MRIAVFGAGAVGGYFGARFAAAGHDVAFIARGRQLAAMRSTGLRIESSLGDLHLTDVTATDDPADLAPVDIVLFCVKLWDVDAAAARLKPLLGPGTGVIPLQNGVDVGTRLAAVVGPEAVMGGTTRVVVRLVEPGLIRDTGGFAEIAYGEWDGRRSPRAEAFLAACEASGVKATLSDDIAVPVWIKFLFLASFSAVTCLTRLPAGGVRADPEAWAFYTDAVREVAAVAAACNVALPPGTVDDVLKIPHWLDPGVKSSMLGDLEDGGRLEVEWLSGAVVRLGRAHGVPTPRHLHALQTLQPLAGGRRPG